MKTYWKGVYDRIKADIMAYRLAILLFVIYYITVEKVFRAFCLLVIMTGYPCPACGMTRAVKFLFLGQFARSWNLHPMAALWVLFAVYCIVMRYFLGRRVKGFQTIAIVLLVAMIVFYIYRMVTIFPDRPPMSYTRNNLLRKLANLLKNLAGQP